jgi:glycerate 2-kinase
MIAHHRELLESLFAAAVAGADPSRAVAGALERDDAFGARDPWIIAVGKASIPMTDAALAVLNARGRGPRGGIIVNVTEARPPHHGLDVVVGSHPVPGAASIDAANRIGEIAAQVQPDDDVLVLVSGGTTSLVASPIDGLDAADLIRLYDGLLGSGADIVVMNAIRKRFSRWGAGRLAAALAPARVRCLIASDVMGDDVASIASGPCAPDALTGATLREIVAREGLEGYLPNAIRAHLDAVIRGELPETPKPGDSIFEQVTCEVVLGNSHALSAAAERARELGLAPVKVVGDPLVDDAAFTASRLVDELVRFREGGLLAADDDAAFACMIWGGETTVRLGVTVPKPGGRCQELALAAAVALGTADGRGHGITMLAAGTDGRDGTTDAAGAIVDAGTVEAIRAKGRDIDADLVEHEAHAALDAVGALLRVGPTGTNVGDIVIGVVEPIVDPGEMLAERSAHH